MDQKTAPSGSSSRPRGPPPPLPPRQSSQQPVSPYPDAPPPYEAFEDPPIVLDHSWTAHDPRSSSTQSLIPAESNQQGDRRRLLLIYIHGFMGNETSFRGFPAHVHNLLTVLLSETHVVHTKLYPRYRSKRNISFARDDFSRWLEPHESHKTDVVLLGHSMGGLLAAEVVLMPAPPPASRPFKHRILGCINFDVPFLGMHPGVVKSGLSSIFKPAVEVQDKWEASNLQTVSSNGGASSSSSSLPTSPLWQPENPDPNFNPTFNNDVVLPMRKGWQNAWHFISKHSDNLSKATKQLVTSHMEFGGAMANYGELKSRYARVRVLEVDDEAVRKSTSTTGDLPPRVRFINYYTASTGRPKVPKPPQDESLPDGVGTQASLEVGGNSGERSTMKTPSPRISLSEHRDGRDEDKSLEGPPEQHNEIVDTEAEPGWHDAVETPAETQSLDPSHSKQAETISPGSLSPAPTGGLSSSSTLSMTASLPPIPDLPTAPPSLDVSYIEDKDTRKLVEKEHTRAVKAYQKAVKDREKILADRAKLEAKREKKALKESEKADRNTLKAKEKAEKEAAKAKQKPEVDALKNAPKELVAAEIKRELTHSEREKLRMEQERLRMEAEARRMRGEPDPAPEEQDDGDEGTQPPYAEEEFIHESMAPEARALSPVPSNVSTEDEQYSPSPSPTLSMSATTSRATVSRATTSRTLTSSAPEPKPEAKPEAPPKDRKFCSLPPKDSNGQRDPCWVRIFMKDVDEVGAHCGLFFVDERYERLVGDVSERIEGWVAEDQSRRFERGVDGRIGMTEKDCSAHKPCEEIKDQRAETTGKLVTSQNFVWDIEKEEAASYKGSERKLQRTISDQSQKVKYQKAEITEYIAKLDEQVAKGAVMQKKIKDYDLIFIRQKEQGDWQDNLRRLRTQA